MHYIFKNEPVATEVSPYKAFSEGLGGPRVCAFIFTSKDINEMLRMLSCGSKVEVERLEGILERLSMRFPPQSDTVNIKIDTEIRLTLSPLKSD